MCPTLLLPIPVISPYTQNTSRTAFWTAGEATTKEVTVHVHSKKNTAQSLCAASEPALVAQTSYQETSISSLSCSKNKKDWLGFGQRKTVLPTNQKYKASYCWGDIVLGFFACISWVTILTQKGDACFKDTNTSNCNSVSFLQHCSRAFAHQESE